MKFVRTTQTWQIHGAISGESDSLEMLAYRNGYRVADLCHALGCSQRHLYGVFMRDIMAIGVQLREEFCSNANMEKLLGDFSTNDNKRRVDDHDHGDDKLEVKKRRVLSKISQNLKLTALRNISSSEIKW